MNRPVPALVALFLGVSSALAAQYARLEGVPPPVRAAVVPILDSARVAGLPIDPLEEKVLEGVTKLAEPGRIAAAVRRLASELAAARGTLGERTSARGLVAGAGALRAGLTAGDVARVGAARGGKDPAIALEVTADLVTRGVPADTAAGVVVTAVNAGASDADLEQLRLAVERDIAGGVPASVAAALRARLVRPASPTRPAPPPN